MEIREDLKHFMKPPITKISQRGVQLHSVGGGSGGAAFMQTPAFKNQYA